jgi:hypothetical protein
VSLHLSTAWHDGVTVLGGVGIGSVATAWWTNRAAATREHRQWQRDQRSDAYAQLLTWGAQLIEELVAEYADPDMDPDSVALIPGAPGENPLPRTPAQQLVAAHFDIYGTRSVRAEWTGFASQLHGQRCELIRMVQAYQRCRAAKEAAVTGPQRADAQEAVELAWDACMYAPERAREVLQAALADVVAAAREELGIDDGPGPTLRTPPPEPRPRLLTAPQKPRPRT